MNENEKNAFYKATCQCCLIANTMKTCPVCQFNIGLAEKFDSEQPIQISLPVRVDFFTATRPLAQ